MADDTHNGWSNRETWAVALHINNDQHWQGSVLDALRSAELDGIFRQGEYRPSLREAAVDAEDMRLAQSQAGLIIRENVEETLEQSWGDTSNGVLVTQAWIGMRNDIGSLWRVNWTELGARFLRDIAEG